MTISVVALYRLGSSIPLPTIRPEALRFVENASRSSTWAFLSGSPSSAIGFFALGVVPYVTASLLLMLLGNVVPSLSRMKETSEGRERSRRISRVLALLVAMFQAFIAASTLVNPRAMTGSIIPIGARSIAVSATLLVLGFIVLGLLVELINRYGIGSGISLLLLVQALSGLGSRLAQSLPTVGVEQILWTALVATGALTLSIVGLRSFYRLIAYSTRIDPTGGGAPAEFRPAILQGGMMTMIFASTMLQLLTGVAGGISTDLGRLLRPDGAAHAVLFSLLVAGFARLQLRLLLDPVRVANDLVQGGYFLENTPPGWPTAHRIAAVGNVAALGITALLVPASLALYLAGSFTGGLATLLPLSSLLLIATIGLDVLRSAKDSREAARVFTEPIKVADPADPWFADPVSATRS